MASSGLISCTGMGVTSGSDSPWSAFSAHSTPRAPHHGGVLPRRGCRPPRGPRRVRRPSRGRPSPSSGRTGWLSPCKSGRCGAGGRRRAAARPGSRPGQRRGTGDWPRARKAAKNKPRTCRSGASQRAWGSLRRRRRSQAALFLAALCFLSRSPGIRPRARAVPHPSVRPTRPRARPRCTARPIQYGSLAVKPVCYGRAVMDRRPATACAQRRPRNCIAPPPQSTMRTIGPLSSHGHRTACKERPGRLQLPLRKRLRAALPRPALPPQNEPLCTTHSKTGGKNLSPGPFSEKPGTRANPQASKAVYSLRNERTW